MNRDHSVIFEIGSKYCISDSFVDYYVYYISSKGFFPTVVDIIVIWVKFTHCSPFQSSLLPSPVWPLPICLDHGPDIPGSYAILVFTALELASIASHIHNCMWFLLWLHCFILSGIIYPLISSSIFGTYRSWEFLFQYSVILTFHFHALEKEMATHSSILA